MPWRNHVVWSAESMTNKEDIAGVLTLRKEQFGARYPSIRSGRACANNNANVGGSTVSSGTALLEYAYTPCISMRVGYWYMVGSIMDKCFLGTTAPGSSVLRSQIIHSLTNGTMIVDYNGAYNYLAQKTFIDSNLMQIEEWFHVGIVITPVSTGFYINSRLVLLGGPITFNHGTIKCLAILSGINEFGQLDDFYLDVSDDVEAQESPPPYRFLPFNLNKQGDSAAWGTTHSAGINTYALGRNNTNESIYADSVGLLDLYHTGAADIDLSYDVAGVGMHVFGNFDARQVLAVTKHGGVEQDHDLASIGAGNVAPGVVAYTDPSGGAWSLAKLRDAQIGVRSST